MNRKAFLYLSIFFLGIILAIALVINLNMKNSEQYVIKVNGEGIPLEKFKVYMKIVKKEKERLAGVTKPEEIKEFWSGPVDGSDPIVFLRQETLASVTNVKIMEQKVKEFGLKITPEAEKLVEEKFKEEGFYEELKNIGIDDNQMKIIVNDTALQLLLYNHITKDVSLTPKELEDFFAQNPDLLKRYKEKRYEVRHILFLTRDENKKDLPQNKQDEILQFAEQVYQKAKGGEDFSNLAKEYSQDPGSKEQGGKLDFIKGEVVKEFEDTVMNLKIGEISKPVKTEYGYHIIKFETIINPSEEEIERIKMAYKDIKIEDERKKVFTDSIKIWNKDAKLDKNEEVLNSININEI